MNNENKEPGNQHIEDGNAEREVRLWAYIDGLSTEATLIQQLVETNEQWRQQYAELLSLHQMITQSPLEQPSMRFTKNVMEEITRLQITPAARHYINNKLITGLALFFITSIIGFVVYGLMQGGGNTESRVGDALNEVSTVNWTRPFTSSYVFYFMMLNTVLCLFLLDRALNEKNKKYR